MNERTHLSSSLRLPWRSGKRTPAAEVPLRGRWQDAASLT